MRPRRPINFRRVADEAARQAPATVERWLPGGRRDGVEYTVRNPRRADSRPGSFKVNLRTGLWADFPSGDRGRDLIALAAFLFDLKQDEAAKRVADMLGVDPFD